MIINKEEEELDYARRDWSDQCGQPAGTGRNEQKILPWNLQKEPALLTP